MPRLTPEERQAVLAARDRVHALTDAVFGDIYQPRRRSGPARDEDEALAVAMATAAGIAADNARLVAQARSQERWQRATAEVTNRLLSQDEPGDVLQLITWHARDISGADVVLLVLPAPDGEHLTVETAIGPGSDALTGMTFPVTGSVSGKVMATGEVRAVDNLGADERVARTPLGRDLFGPGVVFPLGRPGDVRGVMTAGQAGGSPPLSAAAVEMVTTFAAQAGIGLTLAELRRDTQRTALLADRDRIARDLHDLVIQRLFATGMSLEGALPLVPDDAPSGRIRRAVDDLDDTIRDIRSAIFALQERAGPDGPGLRASIVAVADDMTGSLGFTPALRLDGALDAEVPPAIAAEMLATLREALANVARHAGAGLVEVTVEVGADLVLVVRDDGCGLTGPGRGSGLANLAQRAAELGGRLATTTPSGGGTRLEWRVPLPGADPVSP
jgi:signal transduction histidine kinase